MRSIIRILLISSIAIGIFAVSLAQAEIIPIHDVQGEAARSEVNHDIVRVQGIVTADFQGNMQLGGFFMQEEDNDADANPLTSEGIFIYCDPDDIYEFRNNQTDVENPEVCSVDVSVGDLVEVEGEVAEAFSQTQIDATAGSVTIISEGNPLPSPTVLSLQDDLVETDMDRDAYFEAYEGMLITFADILSVSEYYQLARYGQIVLYQGGRPHQYTHVDDTPTPEEYIAYTRALSRRYIILDDDSDVENLPIVRDPSIIFYPQPNGLSIGESRTNNFRGGDTITGLTGVLNFSAGEWRIRPTETFPVNFTPTNPRTATPPETGGTLKVASFNVLNYFTSLNQRGADTDAELERQAAKIVSAMIAIDADIYGLMEIENNQEAVAHLVSHLNATLGSNSFEFIDTGIIGTDEITVALIYNSDTVTPIGVTHVLDDEAFTDPNGIGFQDNRPAVVQTFLENASGESLTVVVNHLKSKGSGCGRRDDDPVQGNCNGTRTTAMQVLVSWLETDPTETGETDILIIGDLNSYAGEDPIDAAIAGGGSFGYTDLLGGPENDNYTYLFDGQLGYLDHALASDSLLPYITGAVPWHINADEMPDFDYNDDIQDAGENQYEKKPDANPMYEASPYRASDHDPVIVGIDLNGGGE